MNKSNDFRGDVAKALNEVVIDNEGERMWICSDIDFCNGQLTINN
ncbi:MAG: hypothetical protein AAFQ80_16005 [Cyanobacteria bacterium J06621_8]